MLFMEEVLKSSWGTLGDLATRNLSNVPYEVRTSSPVPWITLRNFTIFLWLYSMSILQATENRQQCQSPNKTVSLYRRKRCGPNPQPASLPQMESGVSTAVTHRLGHIIDWVESFQGCHISWRQSHVFIVFLLFSLCCCQICRIDMAYTT